MSEESVDLFQSSSLSELEARVAQVEKNFGYHNHDGRNSLEIDANANARNIRLLSLTPFGETVDGNVIITGGTTTLTRDMFYDHLTIAPTGILYTASYRIFADIVEIDGGGIIHNDGGNGAVGGTVGGAAGTHAIGSLPPSGASGAGGDGRHAAPYNNDVAGYDGASLDRSIGVAGSDGGNGGQASHTASRPPGGGGGIITGTVSNTPRSFISAYVLADTDFTNGVLVPIYSSAGSGGGAGGQPDPGWNINAGGGGGAGGSGGIVAIFARQIINSGTIRSKGGVGGNGGNGNTDGTFYTGGGGGGGGGSGGVILLVYGDLSGSGTVDVSAGAAGAGGTKAGGGANIDGLPGVAGLTGNTFNIQVSSLS